ncbi:MAG TPA: sn-glycerol-3-phosphate ABC transporter ATP-binding protein UgpC [Deltaproteobacteria bacterium]|nr:sn-glycerol-3-phosphate ABC transporter ATP-binding protein UgpC [Deltaproteobacteria bacterium]HPR55549.1 sn-glycerol-3-phosphate ABC transporter ATP-binding protein UgpC [Deltaproteobacteria bacterium]HXK46036.1 sn-glycerol-3-phosphate ABC transporter ATP-binding protein UgpC [Deltaproteobacteria bacterium]
MADVVLKNVVKRFGKVEVVHGVNLQFHDNEFIVLVGPSGCGKSTILRMIAGLEKITRGDILINGQVVNDVAPKDRGIAMVFQNYALYPHMNVFNNMSFGLKLSKKPKEEILRRVHETAEILELGELLHRKPHELSGGQRQRVAMGRAMVRNPAIFLFDEPLSNLDAKLRTQMRTEIKLLHQRVKVTTIYVTHDQVEAMTLADRIVVMNNGYVEQVGEPIELFENPANTFVAGFIGSPPMNLVPARTIQLDSGMHLDFNGHLRLPIPERQNSPVRKDMDVIMGIRTEDFSIDNGTNGFPEEWKVEGTVEVVEPLGGETNMHMNMQGVKFMARSEGRRLITVGEKLRMAMNLNHLHIFDAKTSLSIY